MSHMTRPQASMNASSGELAKRKEGKHFGHESRASRRVRSNIGSALRQSLRSLRQSEVPSGLPSKRSALLSRPALLSAPNATPSFFHHDPRSNAARTVRRHRSLDNYPGGYFVDSLFVLVAPLNRKSKDIDD
jgi:hypothetical protein